MVGFPSTSRTRFKINTLFCLGLVFLFLADDTTVLMKDTLDTLREPRTTTISRRNDGDVLGLTPRLHATLRHEIRPNSSIFCGGLFRQRQIDGDWTLHEIWSHIEAGENYHVKPTMGANIRDIVDQRRGRHWMSTTTRGNQDSWPPSPARRGKGRRILSVKVNQNWSWASG